MPLEDLRARAFQPTLPLNPDDPFRFAQVVETAKDAFQVELTRYLNDRTAAFARRKLEVPTIEKFAVASGDQSPAETVTRILLQHPDVLQKLPLIAITSATGRRRTLGIGSQITASVQPPARVKGTRTGPYALVPGDRLVLRTWPKGLTRPPVLSTILFTPQMFVDLGQATLAEVVAAAQAQILYVTPQATRYSDPVGVLRLNAFGPLAPRLYPNKIEVVGPVVPAGSPPGSTQNALDQLGLVAGQSDDAQAHDPANRYHLAYDLTINLDIGTQDANVRLELTDLLLYFFSLVMDERKNQFLGRSWFDDEVPDEWFQVILLKQEALAGEAELPMPGGGGERRDLLYVNRITVPVLAIDSVDRTLSTLPRRGDDLELRRSRVDSDGLPAGDHAGRNDTSG
jgi:hypothetical protein